MWSDSGNENGKGGDRQSKEGTESYDLKQPLFFRGFEQGIVLFYEDERGSSAEE